MNSTSQFTVSCSSLQFWSDPIIQENPDKRENCHQKFFLAP